MDEYLEREKVIKILNANIANAAIEAAVDGHSEEYFDGWTDSTSSAISEMENVPAADVRPVVHGRWQESDMNGDFLYKCSECGDLFFPCDDGQIYFKFCPSCGAVMDGKDGEHNE